MATQSVEERLKAAIGRAAKRLAQEHAGKTSGASDTTKPRKDKPGTPASRVNARDFLGHVAGINDGKHMPAILEKGERVLTPIQTREWDAKHPGARREPSSAVGMPKIKTYDAGGEVSEVPRPKMSQQQKSNLIDAMPGQPRIGTSTTPLLSQISLYDDGGEVTDTDKSPLGQIRLSDEVQASQSAKLRNLPGQPDAVAAPSEAQAEPQKDPEQAHIEMRRDQINQKQDQAIASGDLVGQGQAIIAHRQIDNHEARQTPLGTAMPDLGTPTTATPVYSGPGKPVAPGELIPDKQLPSDEYKFRQQDLDKRIEAAGDKAVNENATPAERAQAQTLADQLEYRKEELKRPAATSVLGKIGRGLETAGNIAGNLVAAPEMSLIPGTALNKARQAQGTLGRINTDIGREKEIAETEAQQDKQTKSPWKAAAGEQFTQYDASGKPIRQLFTNESTGEQQWRDLPTAGGLPRIQTTATPSAETGATPAAGGEYYGTKEQPKFAEKPVGKENVAQYTEQLKSATARAPEGYHLSAPDILPTDTNATATEKVKDYEKQVNDAVLADRADKAQTVRETQAETRERRAEDRKDKGVSVYAEDENGQTILTNKYMAQLKGQAYEVATPGDINKDRQATRQLNDVQLNVSRYTKAANDAAKTEPTTKDYVNMHSILNKAGALDLNIAIGEGGSITIPVLSGLIEGLNREVNSEAYADLSPQGKALLDGYIRSLSAVPAYQKALTGIGRSNKEMLDLELANIPNPTMKPADIQRKLGQFQENIDRATEGFPKLPGLKTAKETRESTENKNKSEPANAPKQGDTQKYAKATYKFDGKQWVKQKQ